MRGWDYKNASTCYIVATIASTIFGRIAKKSLS